MKWKFTHIHHPARIKMGLSQNEYSVFDLIYKSQTHPDFNKDGWATTSYNDISKGLGVSKSTAFSTIEKGFKKGFIEVSAANPELKKTTPKWYNNAYLVDLENERSELEPFGNRTLTVRKPNAPVRKPNANRSETEHININKENSLNKEKINAAPEEKKYESSFDVKDEIIKQKLTSDTAENRTEILKIYNAWINHKTFKSIWAAMSDTFPKADKKEVIEDFCFNGEMRLVKEVAVHKLRNWIKVSHLKNLNTQKNGNNNSKKRNQRNSGIEASKQEYGKINGWG